MPGFIFFIEKRKVVLIAFSLFVLNAVLKILFLDANPVALDEPFSIFYAQMSIPDIIAILKTGNNPPLYEVFLHFWIKWFGIGPFSVRFPSLFFSSLASVVIFLIGKKHFSFTTGVLASVLFSFATIHTYFAHEARVYALFILLTSLSILFFLNYIRSGKILALVGLIVVDVLLVYSHYFGFLLLLNQFIGLFWFKVFRKNIWQTVVALIVLLIAFSPMLGAFVNQFYFSVDGGTWVTPPEPGQYYGFINVFLNNKFQTLLILLFACISLFVIIYNRTKHVQNRYFDNTRLFFYLVVSFVVPYTLMFAFSYIAPMFIERYVVFLSVYLYLFLGAVLSLAPANKYIRLITVSLMVVGMVLSYNINPSNNRQITEAIAYVKQFKNEKSLVLVCPAYHNYAFAYHYNIEYFKHYENTISNLKSEHIYFVADLEEATQCIDQVSLQNIIYFQAAAQYADPKGEIYDYISSLATLEMERNFFETYTVSVFDVIGNEHTD